MNEKRQKTTLKKRTLNKEAIIKAIDGSFGNITFIAKRLTCHRSTIHDNINKFGLSGLVEEEEKRFLT
jgi:transcriptional regulator of acetoin/glycerol metabolism